MAHDFRSKKSILFGFSSNVELDRFSWWKIGWQQEPTLKLDASSWIPSNPITTNLMLCNANVLYRYEYALFKVYSIRGTCASQWTTNDVVGSIYISLHRSNTHALGGAVKCISRLTVKAIYAHMHPRSFNVDVFGIGGSIQMATKNSIEKWNVFENSVHVCGFCYCVDSIFVYLQTKITRDRE